MEWRWSGTLICRSDGGDSHILVDVWRDTVPVSKLTVNCESLAWEWCLRLTRYGTDGSTDYWTVKNVCGTNVDYGVLAVCCDTDGSMDYWKVKHLWERHGVNLDSSGC